ncbi:RNA-directed DNA polymerase, eukaryota [Tanacetum coccineum]
MWSDNTFKRIASKWGTLIHADSHEDGNFYTKRICINTNITSNILESFKIIYRGKLFWVRAKEVPGWEPDFMEDNDDDSDNDDDLINDLKKMKNWKPDQIIDLECDVSKDEIKRAVWDCGPDESWPDGSKVGGHMSRIQSWNETIEAMASRLSKWKMKTLSIGGRLTLLKSVLGSMPIYHMSIFKVPMKILQRMESIRSHFFNGSDPLAKKPTWVKWTNGESGSKDQFDSLKAMVEGDFTVASIRKLIDEFTLSEVSSSTRWIKAVPIKVNVLAWKIKLDNLPTRLNISRRGMDIDSILCPTCGKAVESTRHIFFTCQIARDILHLITSWWNIPYMEVSSYEEWLVWILSLPAFVQT